MGSATIIDSNLTDLQLLSKGKVRDIYATSDPNLLLFVASDRISAYDVILRNVRPLSIVEPHKKFTTLLLHMSMSAPVPPLRLGHPDLAFLPLGFAVGREQGVPDKGKVLTKISLFWFDKLKHVIPTHFVTADVEAMPAEVRRHKDVIAGRAMLVKKAKVVPLEAIVRGYLSGGRVVSYLLGFG